ncbi:hypothetical protein NT017_01930 [Prolixibacter sp. NT017]|nr:hypothetical protein NT017_01930 [Prolixibacter sp. NT017]
MHRGAPGNISLRGVNIPKGNTKTEIIVQVIGKEATVTKEMMIGLKKIITTGIVTMIEITRTIRRVTIAITTGIGIEMDTGIMTGAGTGSIRYT